MPDLFADIDDDYVGEADPRHEPPAALVTGATRGIGLAVAIELARRGHPVMMTDLCDQVHASAELLRYEVGPSARVASTILDVADEESIAAGVAETTSLLGAPLVMVNNAAVSRPTPTADTTRALWDDVIAVNLTGPFLCSREVLPHMRAAAFGRIVMISSWDAVSAPVAGDNASYVASKAGLLGLVRNLAVELAGDGITVNAVSPGVVETELLRATYDAQLQARLRSRVPVGRFTTPDEIAASVAFLCSRSTSSITGEVLNVNGGLCFA